MASTEPEDPTLARSRARRTVVKVFAVEIVTLVALWLLGRTFGAP